MFIYNSELFDFGIDDLFRNSYKLHLVNKSGILLLSPLSEWTFPTKSTLNVEKVHSQSGQSPLSDRESGLLPLSEWTFAMKSTLRVEEVHSQSGKSPLSESESGLFGLSLNSAEEI